VDRRRLTLSVAAALTAASVPAGPAGAAEIVLSRYGRDSDEPARIVVMDAGRDRRTIARAPFAWSPRWSPDHSRVAFWGARTYDAGFDEVSVVTRSGRRQRRITGYGWAFPSWSPNGRWIAAACADPGLCERRPGLYRIRAAHPRRKARVRGTAGASTSSWAPGGERIVFVSSRRGRGDLFVKRFGSPRLRRITSSGVDEAAPDWSPGGRWIVFSKPRRPQLPHDLWLVRPDGEGLRRLTRTRANETSPAWSPSGARILFTTARGLFTVRSDGTGRRKVPGTRRRDCCADW
jgi:TolB protein